MNPILMIRNVRNYSVLYVGNSLRARRLIRHALAAVALLCSCLLPSLPASVAADNDESRPAGEPRKEGQWEVTPIGPCHDRLYYPQFPGQHRLLIAVDADPAQLWDTQTGKRIAILADQKRGIDSCAISPDKTQLLTADRLGGWNYHIPDEEEQKKKVIAGLWLWDLSTGKLLKKIDVDLSAKEMRDSTDWTIKWLGKDKVLVQLDCRQNPARASVRTILGHLDLATAKVTKWSGPESSRESLCRSPDGKRALAGREYGVWRQEDGDIAWGGRGTTYSVDLIDMTDNKVIATVDESKRDKNDHRSIVCKRWSGDSRWFATVGSDNTVGIWGSDKGKPVSRLEGHKDWILAIAFSPDGKRLVTASEDETARLWDTSTGKQLRTFEGHTAGLNSAVFDSTGERIVTAGEDETARLWDVATGKQLRAWGKHESAVRSAGFERDEKSIWTRTAQGVRRVWKIEDGSLLSESKPLSTDSNRFGVLYLKQNSDKLYEMWSGPPGVPGEGQIEGVPPQLRPQLSLRANSQFRAGAITADGKTLASRGKDRSICIWDVQRWDKVTGEGRTFLPTQPSEIWQLAITPDGKSLAVAYEEGSVRLWDLATRKERLKCEGNANHLRSLVFSSDGTMLAGCSWKRSLYLWKVSTGKLILSKADVTGPIHAVAFSPDGTTLASAGMVRDPDGKDDSFYKPGEIILWDVASGKAKRTLAGFRTAVESVAFTPDGKTLIAGDFDYQLFFYDVATGEKRAVVKGTDDTASYLAISPDSKLLVSAHDFSDVMELWEIGSAKEIGRFRSPAGRGGSPMFTPDGRTLISGGRQVLFWDVADLRKSVVPPKLQDDK